MSPRDNQLIFVSLKEEVRYNKFNSTNLTNKALQAMTFSENVCLNSMLYAIFEKSTGIAITMIKPFKAPSKIHTFPLP